MPTWVLIIVASTFGAAADGGVAVDTVEFSSQALCEAAREALVLANRDVEIEAMCMLAREP